jgi:hypothetical protein
MREIGPDVVDMRRSQSGNAVSGATRLMRRELSLGGVSEIYMRASMYCGWAPAPGIRDRIPETDH